MKAALGLASLVFVGLSAPVFCQPGKDANATSAVGPRLQISGQVFIVTKGRENIKMALVEVLAISEKKLSEHLTRRHMAAIEEAKLLAPAVEAAKQDAEPARLALRDAGKALNDSRARQGHLTDQEYVQQLGAEGRKALLEDGEKLTRLGLASREKSIAHRKLESEYAALKGPRGPRFYFEQLPEPIGRTKTDAEGKFSLSLPKGNYVLAAKAMRSVAGNEEEYYWLIKIDSRSQTQALMLSNDNMVVTRCAECVQLPN